MATASPAAPSKFTWTDSFHVQYGGRSYFVGKRPAQVNFYLRLERNRRQIVRSLGTSDVKTATKNAQSLLKKIIDTDWETAERDRKLARRKTVSDAIALYEQRFKGKSAEHQAGFRSVFKLFQLRFGSRYMGDVRAAELDHYLSQIENENTRAKHFTYLHGFWRWADRLEHVAENPMRRLDRPKTTPRRNILTPAQMAEILAARDRMPDWLFASLLLGAFAGIRTSEICRMQWQDVDTAREQIDVQKAKGSDATPFPERIVDMLAPIHRRAALFAGKTGHIIPREPDADEKAVEAWYCGERAKFIAGVLGWEKWPENCLRHSFATYHLAQVKNPTSTAYQMGHSSPAMVRKVYAVPAKRVVSDEWWSL